MAAEGDAIRACIDPGAATPLAILTHAHGDHVHPGCASYVATPETARIARERVRHGATFAAHRYGEPFAWGAARVSLHPSGHILGAAQVRIEDACGVTVVTGDFKREADPTCAAFAALRADTLHCEATFAARRFVWPEVEQIVAEILAWWRANTAQGRSSLLFCHALGKAQRLQALLAPHIDPPILVHRKIAVIDALYRELGVQVTGARIPGDRPPRWFAGRLILAPPGIDSGAWRCRFGKHAKAFASGWAGDATALAQRGFERGFALSDHADWAGLLRTVEESGARRVRFSHGIATELIEELGRRGVDAAPA